MDLKIGYVGPDGNSSLWKYVDEINSTAPYTAGNADMGPGTFATLDAIKICGNKSGVTQLLIVNTDHLGTDLTDWVNNMDVGDIIYIRKQNVINEVAYYTVSDNLLANGPPTPNGGWLIEVTYIDSDTTPFSFAGNDYYIG